MQRYMSGFITRDAVCTTYTYVNKGQTYCTCILYPCIVSQPWQTRFLITNLTSTTVYCQKNMFLLQINPPYCKDRERGQSPCSPSKHGCLRPRKRVSSLKVLIGIMPRCWQKCFKFQSEAPDFIPHQYLLFRNKTCRFIKTPCFINKTGNVGSVSKDTVCVEIFW